MFFFDFVLLYSDMAKIMLMIENSKAEDVVVQDGDFNSVPDVQQEVEIQTTMSDMTKDTVTIISEMKPCTNSNVEIVVLENDDLISEGIPEVKQEVEIETDQSKSMSTKSLDEDKDKSFNNDVSIDESLDEAFPVPRDDPPLSTQQLNKNKFKKFFFYCDSDGYVQAYCHITCQKANWYQQGKASIGCWFGPKHPK